MGVNVTVDGRRINNVDYRVTEYSVPIAGGDSSGGIGTISISTSGRTSPLGLAKKGVELLDTARGNTSGTVSSVSHDRGSDAISITSRDRLGAFIIQAQVQPFRGTLGNAFRYYASIANQTTGIVIDPLVNNIPVAFPGWYGDLWAGMKDLAPAMGCDLNVVSGNIVLRPIRGFEAIQGRGVSESVNISSDQLALKQEVIWYNTEYRENSLVYPAGGWNDKVVPLNISAATTEDFPIEIESSLSSIVQPVPVANVGPNDSSASVYTVTGDDNLPIQPSQWTAFGGKLTVAINPDTSSLTVTITGATGLARADGTPIQTYRIALPSGPSNFYSTLRIIGTGVHLNKQSLIVPTGLPDWATGQEFAPVIDNKFINNLPAAYSAATSGASRYTGKNITLSSEVTAINKRGAQGSAAYPEYRAVKAQWAPRTYAQVKAMNSPKSYATIRSDLYAAVATGIDNQLFGNAPGARVWDRITGRFFRIRQADTSYGSTSISAESDMTNADMNKIIKPRTYAQFKALAAGRSYYDVNIQGGRIVA